MATPSTKAMIYDADCPMCRWFTRKSVEADLLEPQNRVPFSTVNQTPLFSQLDPERSRLEIPLVDLDGGPTLYGVDSLVFLLAQPFSLLRKLIKLPLIGGVVRTLYHFISYNRRIISGSSTNAGLDCIPPVHRGYRLAYIAFASLLAALISFWLGTAITQHPELGGFSPVMVLLAVGCGWIMQAATAIFYPPRLQLDYLGHLATVMLVGVLVLVPGLLLTSFLLPGTILPLVISVLLSATIMFRLHHARVNTLGLPSTVHLSWVFFLACSAMALPFIY